MRIILYTTHCPRCEILKKKLNNEGVEYEECDNVDEMLHKGIMTAPQLEVDGKIYSFSEALLSIKDFKEDTSNE